MPSILSGLRVAAATAAGSTIPVASLRAAFVSTSIGFDEACSFIEPSHWPGCSDFWCEMVKLAEPLPGLHRYHEHVSTDCGQPLAWTVSCELDFRFEKRQHEASAVYRGSLDAARRGGVPWRRVRPGDSLVVDGLVVRALAPDSAWVAGLRDANSASTVLLVRYGAVRLLLTGDAEAPEEAELVARWGAALRADVLKVPHHGSATSSTPPATAGA